MPPRPMPPSPPPRRPAGEPDECPAESAGAAPGTEIALDVDAAAAGSRVDVFLARAFPGRSRSFLASSSSRESAIERAYHTLWSHSSRSFFSTATLSSPSAWRLRRLWS